MRDRCTWFCWESSKQNTHFSLLFLQYNLTTNVAKAVWGTDTISTSHQGCSCQFFHTHKNREVGRVMEASRWLMRKNPPFPTSPRGKTGPSTPLKLTHIVVLPKHVSRDKKALFLYGFTPFKWFLAPCSDPLGAKIENRNLCKNGTWWNFFTIFPVISAKKCVRNSYSG